MGSCASCGRSLLLCPRTYKRKPRSSMKIPSNGRSKYLFMAAGSGASCGHLSRFPAFTFVQRRRQEWGLNARTERTLRNRVRGERQAPQPYCEIFGWLHRHPQLLVFQHRAANGVHTLLLEPRNTRLRRGVTAQPCLAHGLSSNTRPQSSELRALEDDMLQILLR